MIRVNLLPPEYRALVKRRRIIVATVALAGFIVFIMMGFLAERKTYASKLERQRMEMGEELTQLQNKLGQMKQIEASRSTLQNRVNVIAGLNQKRLLFPVLFDDFLAEIPAGVWITSLQTSPQGNGFLLTVNAKANSNFALANWISNLEKSAYFKSPQIGPINYEASAASFVLTCNYEHPSPVKGT